MTQADRIGTHEMWVEDFTVTCSMKTAGERCTSTAKYWVAYHHPGQCTHPALDSDGNHCTWVCGIHLFELKAKAASVVRYYNPPRWLRWFVFRHPFCGTCGRPVQHEGDVLQEQVPLWQ